MATNEPALSEEAFFHLFLLVEENECLWRLEHEGYKNVHKKARIWESICERLRETFPELDGLKPGMKVLVRAQYRICDTNILHFAKETVACCLFLNRKRDLARKAQEGLGQNVGLFAPSSA